MKLSTSSSIFFATLALSSSSSTLAAPARDATESGLAVSPSSHDMFDSSVHPAAHCSAHRTQPQPTPVEGTSGTIAARTSDILAELDQLLSNLLKKVSPLVGQNLAEADGVSAPGISPEDMAVVQAAIQEITQALNNTTVVSKLPAPSSVKNAPGAPPKVAQSDFDPAGGPAAVSVAPGSASPMSSAQASSTPRSLAVNEVQSSSSTFPSASATPPSPVVPLNPNSPSLPVHLPV